MSDRATRDRLSLLRAAMALAQVRDPEVMLTRIMDEVTRVLDADRSTLFMLDTAKNELCSRIAQRSEDVIRVPMGRGLAGHVAKTGAALSVDNAYDDPRFSPEMDRQTGYHTKSVACAPILTPDGRTLGVLEVMNRREGVFDADDVKLLTAFAGFGAVVLDNARLFEDNRKKTQEIEALNKQLRETLERRTARLVKVEAELAVSLKALAPPPAAARGIVGRSQPVRDLLKLVERVAPAHEPVLLVGESGTGKELVARAIHFGSRRAAAPFVTENCGAVADTLLEAELFGHRKGAFTGADRDRPGLFETAHGGTLLLDEVGEMSLDMQKKLLRVLQEGEVRAVGAREPRKVDVRIIAATHRNLEAMIKEKTFREDLYYRLNVIRIPLPPLRDRREDIPLLVDHFLNSIARESGRDRLALSDSALKRMVRYAWPGNVRELENEIRRACVMADALIGEEHLSPRVMEGAQQLTDILPRSDTGRTLKEAKQALEKRMIEEALKRSGGNVAKAARELGVHRPQLSVLLGKHGLRRGGADASADDSDE